MLLPLCAGQGANEAAPAVTQYAEIPTVTQQDLNVQEQCGLPGEGYDRVQASIDFTLCCKAMGKACCAECKCQWARYYELASVCFPFFPVYEAEVEKRLKDWNKDAKANCKIRDELGTMYASNTANDIWRAEHRMDPPPNDNIMRTDQRRQDAGLPELEWCGTGAAVAPNKLFVAAIMVLLAGFMIPGR